MLVDVRSHVLAWLVSSMHKAGLIRSTFSLPPLPSQIALWFMNKFHFSRKCTQQKKLLPSSLCDRAHFLQCQFPFHVNGSFLSCLRAQITTLREMWSPKFSHLWLYVCESSILLHTELDYMRNEDFFKR